METHLLFPEQHKVNFNMESSALPGQEPSPQLVNNYSRAPNIPSCYTPIPLLNLNSRDRIQLITKTQVQQFSAASTDRTLYQQHSERQWYTIDKLYLSHFHYIWRDGKQSLSSQNIGANSHNFDTQETVQANRASFTTRHRRSSSRTKGEDGKLSLKEVKNFKEQALFSSGQDRYFQRKNNDGEYWLNLPLNSRSLGVSVGLEATIQLGQSVEVLMRANTHCANKEVYKVVVINNRRLAVRISIYKEGRFKLIREIQTPFASRSLRLEIRDTGNSQSKVYINGFEIQLNQLIPIFNDFYLHLKMSKLVILNSLEISYFDRFQNTQNGCCQRSECSIF